MMALALSRTAAPWGVAPAPLNLWSCGRHAGLDNIIIAHPLNVALAMSQQPLPWPAHTHNNNTAIIRQSNYLPPHTRCQAVRRL